MNHFFTADLHFSHGRIMLYCNRVQFMNEQEVTIQKSIQNIVDPDEKRKAQRNFFISQSSIDRMNKALMDNINAKVGRNDKLKILGDFCWAKHFSQVKEARSMINCLDVALIKGNHDYFRMSEYRTIFSSVGTLEEEMVNKQLIVMCHYPMLRWNRSHHNSIMIFGHSHGSMNPWIEKYMTEMRMLDVGVDGHNYFPWSFDEIREVMNKKMGEKLGEGTE